MEVDDKLLKPFLTFSLDQENKNTIGAKGGSWMHEYVMDFADDIFMEEMDYQSLEEGEESSKEPDEMLHCFKFSSPINRND